MGGLAGWMRRPVVPVTALVVASLLALAASPAAPADEFTFVQVQRVNSLTLQFGTDTYATHNAFGGAFGGVVQSSMQSALTSAVADGSITWLLEMPGLSDLSGTNNTPFAVGVFGGTPVQAAGNPATYDGSSDLDWWYVPDASNQQLTANFTARTFNAGPGSLVLHIAFGGQPATLAMSSTQMQAHADDPSAPLKSTNGFPPGHEADENLPDS